MSPMWLPLTIEPEVFRRMGSLFLAVLSILPQKLLVAVLLLLVLTIAALKLLIAIDGVRGSRPSLSLSALLEFCGSSHELLSSAAGGGPTIETAMLPLQPLLELVLFP